MGYQLYFNAAFLWNKIPGEMFHRILTQESPRNKQTKIPSSVWVSKAWKHSSHDILSSVINVKGPRSKLNSRSC